MVVRDIGKPQKVFKITNMENFPAFT